MVKHLNPRVVSEDIIDGEVKEPDIAPGAVLSGHVASGQIGMRHIYAWGGFGSSADTTITVYHNLGVVPERWNIYLTPRANANYWVATVTASSVVINTSVSGVGCDVKVFAL